MIVGVFAQIQIVLLILFTLLVQRQRLGFYACFYGIFMLLLVIPFHIIFLDIHGWLDIDDMLGRRSDAKVTLALGDGMKPMLTIYMFQFLYLVGGSLATFLPPSRKPLAPRLVTSRYETAAVMTLVGCLAYIGIRYIFVPDYPLFAWLASGGSGAGLRDLAFEYGSRTDVPYLFLPSINANVIRIGLPAASFMLLSCAQGTTNSRARLIGRAGYIISMILVFGTFKRTPLLYFILWNTLYHQLYTGLRSVGKMILIGVLIFVSLTAITAMYGGDLNQWQHSVKNILWRFLVGEAIGEFVAVEHFGTTFDYLGAEIPWSYAQKVMGQDVLTFSEYWKIESGGTRGYTSIGIMSELAISLGPMWSVAPFVLWGWIMAFCDRIAMTMNQPDRRPFMAGMVVIVSFMSVKGFFSQMFAGGAICLFLLTIVIIFNCRQSNQRSMMTSRAYRPQRMN